MRALFAVIIFVVLGAAGAANYVMLSEADGDGPPHFGRTENMDKWSDPRPTLALVNGVALCIVLGCLYRYRRRV